MERVEAKAAVGHTQEYLYLHPVVKKPPRRGVDLALVRGRPPRTAATAAPVADAGRERSWEVADHPLKHRDGHVGKGRILAPPGDNDARGHPPDVRVPAERLR